MFASSGHDLRDPNAHLMQTLGTVNVNILCSVKQFFGVHNGHCARCFINTLKLVLMAHTNLISVIYVRFSVINSSSLSKRQIHVGNMRYLRN